MDLRVTTAPRMDPLAKLLNPPQLEAVRYGEGPLLILAGAGSGKTRVLTHRIAHLLREKLARAPEILAVTFTNKAAGELQERIANLVGPEDARRLWVATFHAASARILRREAEALKLTRSFAIYDDADQLAEVKRATSDLGMDTATARQHLQRIDRWKNAGLLPSEVVVAEYDVPAKTALKVYARYQAALQASNAVDFGDLILRVLELFKARPEIAQQYSGRFRYILVDEFQDTNPAQYQLLRALAKEHGNLGVVGDDDQSIYRWRGAEVDNILDFAKHFPGTKVVRPEQNYRSTQRILTAAHAIIEKNERRAEKKLWTAAGDGEKVRVLLADDERDEARRIATEIYAENARGTSYGEMAVFYRANAQSRALEDGLRQRRIPYRVVRGRSFYERAEVKDVAAYLRLCVNPRSDGDLLRVINTPPRGIGDTTVENLRKSAAAQGLSLWETLEGLEDDTRLSSSARAKLLPFRELMRRLQRSVAADGAAAPAIERVIEETGYGDRMRLEGEEGQDRLENLLELVGAAQEFDRLWAEARGQAPAALPPPAPGPAPVPTRAPIPNAVMQTRAQYLRAVRAAPGSLGSPTADDQVPGERPDLQAALAAAAPDEGPDTPLLGFLEQLALVGDADAAEGTERVALMTLHAAKGLEFDAVWMTGLEERVFPSSRSLGQSGPYGGTGEEDPDEMAEERRLCYVGMTRARKKLTMTLARSRSLFGELRFNPPSRFVHELPEELAAGLEALRRNEPPAFLKNAPEQWTGRQKPRSADEFDQRPVFADGPPLPPRNKMRAGDRTDPAAKPPVRQLTAEQDALSPGRRVRHPSFGVGTVEESDGLGQNRKLAVRFGPGVGLKKVLARFVEPH